MDSKFLVRIAKFVEGLLERSLTLDEKKQLISFVKQNHEFVRDKRIVVQVAELANEYVDFIEGIDGLDGMESIDTSNPTKNQKNQLIHQNLNMVSFLGLDTFDRFISELNPQAKRKRAYMCLDSRYARFNQACTKLTWDFTNNLNVINNSTNVVGPVRDITWIRMHSIVVRKFTSIPQRATVLIEELSSQAFIMPNGRRFHFVGLLNDLSNPIPLNMRNAIITDTAVPDPTIYDKYELLAGFKFNEGYYRFNKPITTLNEITVSIGNPDTLVVLPKYEFTNVTIADIQATYIDLEFNENHNYTNHFTDFVFLNNYAWYSIFLDGFSSSNVALNDYLNQREHTHIEVLTPTIIRIYFRDLPAGSYWMFTFPAAIPLTPFIPPPLPWSISTVRFNSYRIIMNFELEYISK